MIDLGREQYPRQARPDAWFVYRLRSNTLVGFVEVDRGTERSPSRWQEKFACYAPLLRGDTVRQLTGQERGRVLVIAPDARRRDAIYLLLQELLEDSEVLEDRFWVAERSVLEEVYLREAVWRVPERNDLMLPGRSGSCRM